MRDQGEVRPKGREGEGSRCLMGMGSLTATHASSVGSVRACSFELVVGEAVEMPTTGLMSYGRSSAGWPTSQGGVAPLLLLCC